MGKINPKLKVCAFCELPKPVFRYVAGDPQCITCYRYQNAVEQIKKRVDRPKSFKKVQKTEKAMTKEAADVKFSYYIRLLHSMPGNGGRVVKCFTCDRIQPVRAMQCGHYKSRANMFTRWMPTNARPQCHDCNVLKGGNYEEFTKRLEEECPGITEQLDQLAKTVWTPSKADIEELMKNLDLELTRVGKS